MKKVLVIFGGASSEHDVSVVSANSVIKNIPDDKYETVMLGITKDGQWFKYTGDPELLINDIWAEDTDNCTPAMISPNRKDHSILVFTKNGVEKEYIDVVFPVLHGKNGEDGTIQGYLQLAGIPYVGCDCVSSGICMDKELTNIMTDAAGFPQAKWLGVKRYEYKINSDEILKQAEEKLGYPIFVKPANAGSSVGISKATDLDSLKKAVETAFEHDEKLVFEEGIDGHEVECAVMGNDGELFASIPGEIVPCNDFYDYEAKYIAGTSKLNIPAEIGEEKLEEVREAAKKVYGFLGCSGLARVDFFVRKSDGLVMLNEPNTIPGFTSISMYSKMMEKSGIPYSELIDKLLTLAQEKWS